MALSDIATRLFADGADLGSISTWAVDPRITGFTTNPTLMHQAGLREYASFATQMLEHVPEHPVSFEVFADEAEEIRRQAKIISSWGENVYVKVPVTTTQGQPLAAVAGDLASDGIKLNVTALFTVAQVEHVASSMAPGAPVFLSVFAGRIADTGIDPLPVMRAALEQMRGARNTQLIWASPRELLNIFQADDIGCDVITVTNDILKKLSVVGKDQDEYSLETVKMFYEDGKAAGYKI